MRLIERWPRLFAFAPVACGMVLFSQGLSFARWNEFMDLAYYVDLHAVLLTVAGVGMFFGGLLLDRLVHTNEKLRDRLRELESGDARNESSPTSL